MADGLVTIGKRAAVKAPPSQLALAVIVCVLALVALARSEARPVRTTPLRAASPGQSRPAPRVQAVRALREGEALDLNQATAGDLLLLPGIGPKLAQRILEERTRRHGYAAVDELGAVKGIGPAKLAQLRTLLRVAPLQVPQPRQGEGDTEVERLALPVGQHEHGPDAQAEHELAPH